MSNNVISDNESYIFECPHCNQFIEVPINEINCRIFRHAVYKHNMAPIHPHATQLECDKLLQTEQIYGCSKPFILNKNQEGNLIVEICDYI